MRLLFLDTKANNPNRYISRAVYDALCRQPALRQVAWADYADALALACRQQFDAFLAFDGEEADNLAIHRLCQLIPRRAIWFTEDPYEFQRNQAVAARFDVIFTNDAATAARYPGQAVHLPLAADRDRHFQPITDRPPLYDLFFAGSAWPNRLEFLNRLRQARPNLRCKIILVNNPALAPYIQAWQERFVFSRGVAIRDFCRLANRSLLTLTLSRRFAASVASFDAASDTPGPRLFEVAAAGSCQLVDAETMPMAAALFDPASHFCAFTDFDACLAHIDQLLAQPTKARSMALAAQRATRDQHLYDHRAADIIKRLADCTPAAIASEPHRQYKVLFVTHNIVEHGHFGGAELHLEEARRHLKRADSWVLVADHRSQPIYNYLLYGPTGDVIEHFTLKTAVQPGDLLHAELEDIFQSILERYGFDLVHFNHIMRFPFSLPILAKAFGVRTVYSLHDYYLICENFNLIGAEGKYCDIPARPPGVCDACLVRTRGFPVGSQARRLAFLRRAFDALDAVLAPSKASADIFTALFPHLGERITLLPPPIVVTGQRGRPIGAGDRLHVGLLGNFTRIKGADIALDVFQRCRDLPLVFHIFGRIDAEFDAAFDHLPSETVIRHGAYTGRNLPAAFGDCDVALFLSPWPETYCIVLSEAQAAGIVPVVADLGAQGERVRDGIDGLKVPVGDAGAVTIALERLQDRDWLRQLAAALPRQPGISGVHFATALDAFYADALKERRIWDGVLEPSRHFSLDELGVVLASPRWAEPAALASPSQSSVGTRKKLAFLRRKFITALRRQGVGYAARRAVVWAMFQLRRRSGWPG